MKYSGIRWWLATPLALLTTLVVRADEPKRVDELLTALQAESFQERSTATAQLTQVSEHGLLDLALRTDDEDVRLRLVTALETVFLARDDAVGVAAEKALITLSESGESMVSTAARKVLLTHSRVRETRARRDLTALGAELVYSRPDSLRMAGLQAVAPGLGAGFGNGGLLSGIWLHNDWRGSSDDLWHLKRFPHRPHIEVYSIRGNGLELIELIQFAAGIPGMEIVDRGPCLGIRSSLFNPGEAVIGHVLRGTSADDAGLRENDQIVAVNGKKINTFNQLVMELQAFEIGDTVELDVIRGFQEIQIDVTLKSWRGINQTDHDDAGDVPAPFHGPFSQSAVMPPSIELPQRLSETHPVSPNAPLRRTIRIQVAPPQQPEDGK